MGLKGIVLRVCLSSLIGGLGATKAMAQDVVYTQDHFTFEAGTAGLRVPVEARVIKGAPFSADIVTESIRRSRTAIESCNVPRRGSIGTVQAGCGAKKTGVRAAQRSRFRIQSRAQRSCWIPTAGRRGRHPT